jgi:hypothetical protein
LVSPRLIITALHNSLDSFNKIHTKMTFYPKRNYSIQIIHNYGEFAEVIDIRYCKTEKQSDKIASFDDYCLLLLDKPIQR